MVPAKGTLHMDKTFDFNYRLSDNPNAAVHVGWLVSMASHSRDMLQKIDSSYKAGIKDFIITGHSQGGGTVFLLTSYLRYLQQENKIPANIQFKTYCSAGPKPGNLFYAYDYEHLTSEGWAYNVVNSADWVPEVPFSIQTVIDFTAINPFTNAKAVIKKQKFPKNLVLKHVYNRLSEPSLKAQRRYQKYLGGMASKMVKKQLPDFTPQEYFKSNSYVRTGSTIVLYADEEYFKLYNNDPSNPNIWRHHLPVPYLFLAEKLP
ncbi:MAG: lipase family protein [Flavitalea sp.]